MRGSACRPFWSRVWLRARIPNTTSKACPHDFRPARHVYSTTRAASTSAPAVRSASEGLLPSRPPGPPSQDTFESSLPRGHGRRDPEAWMDLLDRHLADAASTGRISEAAQDIVVAALQADVDVVVHHELRGTTSDTAQAILSTFGTLMMEHQIQRATGTELFHILPKPQHSVSLDAVTDDVVDSPDPSEHASMDHLTARLIEANAHEIFDFSRRYSAQWRANALDTRTLAELSQPVESPHSLGTTQLSAKAGSFWRIMGDLAFQIVEMRGRTSRDFLVSVLWTNMTWIAYNAHVMDRMLATYERLSSHGAHEEADILTWLRAVPAHSTSPPQLDLEPAALLEMVLWFCVHCGYAEIAAELLIANRITDTRHGSWLIVPHSQRHRYRRDKYTLSSAVSTAIVDDLRADLSHPFHNMGGLQTSYITRLLRELRKMPTSAPVSMTDDTLCGLVSNTPVVIPGQNRMLHRYQVTYTLETRRGAGAHRRTGESPSYLVDETAVPLALYHQLIDQHTQARDALGAARALADLQSYVDIYRRKTVLAFFDDIQSINRETKPTTDLSSYFRGTAPRNTYVELPRPLLATFLDLLTDSGDLDFARWMLYSGNNAEGPLVSPALYSDPIVAPAIIRYAAVAQDDKLLSRLLRRQATAASADILVALCENRFRSGNLKDGVRVLNMIGELGTRAWSVQDIARLTNALLWNVRSDAGANLRGATLATIVKLLRGDLGITLNKDRYEMVGITRVLSDADTQLRKICRSIFDENQVTRVEVSMLTFDTLLQGICAAFGSVRGRAVYLKWCVPAEEIQRLSDSPLDMTWSPVSRLFNYKPSPEASSEILAQPHLEVPIARTSAAIITPTLRTLRVVIHQALKESQQSESGDGQAEHSREQQDQAKEISTGPHQVLSWAREILESDFNLGDADIDHELQGYFNAVPRFESLAVTPHTYSIRTLRLWRSISEEQGEEAGLDLERRLRSFCQIDGGDSRTMKFEDLPIIDRGLVQSLCQDYGLEYESFKSSEASLDAVFDADMRNVVVRKPSTIDGSIKIPNTRVQEAADRWYEQTYKARQEPEVN